MNENKIKILLADDEPDILKFLKYNLEREGYCVITCTNGKDAIELAKQELPHLIMLDIMMPLLDGVEACREIKNLPQLKHTLVAFLTARSEDYSEIAGFDVGADDYITKPIKPRVLMARIRALLKRFSDTTTTYPNNLIPGDIIIDKDKYLIYKDGAPIQLPRKEFELLALLFSKPGKVFTREEIFSKIWGDELIVGERTIDVHIRKLREKIGSEYIQTVKGIGYKYTF